MKLESMLTAVLLGCIFSGPLRAAVPVATGDSRHIAVSTNIAYDLAGGLNLGLEYPFTDRISARIDYVFPWFVGNSNKKAYQLIHFDAAAKYYFAPGSVMSGFYASGGAGAGYYDFENKGKGRQGEELMFSLGGGWTKRLNDKWFLDFGLTIGPLFSKFRYYECEADSNRLIYRHDGHFFYFGPTGIRASISYFFPLRLKKK